MPTILIVDDDPGAAETFTYILTNNGYGVEVAADAESAWLDLERVAPAAILLDLHLPMAGGLEFFRRLRAASGPHASVPIAIITADYFLDDDVVRELQILGVRVHFKPLWAEDLLALVHNLLDSALTSPPLIRPKGTTT